MIKSVNYLFLTVLAVLFIPVIASGQQVSAYEIRKLSINSDGFNEISPVIVKNGILFCSDRRFSIIKDRTAYDGHRLFNIYLAEQKDSIDWGKPVELQTSRNSLFNNGPLCVSADGETFYFTSEIETGVPARMKNFKNHSGIFIAELSGTALGSLTPFKYNSADYNTGQPSISNDGKYLFFVSDMPGGSGGSDLMFCEWVNGEWAAPVNLGPKVNSAVSENYPFIHPSGRLYFSSSRPGGRGNLDIYFTTLINGQWDTPVLLPEPINSASDDFSYVAETDLKNGYFSSNRDRNDDIYKFKSTIIRKTTCDTLIENSFCYRFVEENAVKADTLPFRYEWNFGDGTSAAGALVEHCYSGPGTYVVQLDVVNLITNEVSYNEKSETLEVIQIEQPYISGPDTINAGSPLTLDANETYLPGWKITQYYWNFGDETINVGNRIGKTYLKPGTYNVQLIVSGVKEPGGLKMESCVSKNIIVKDQP